MEASSCGAQLPVPRSTARASRAVPLLATRRSRAAVQFPAPLSVAQIVSVDWPESQVDLVLSAVSTTALSMSCILLHRAGEELREQERADALAELAQEREARERERQRRQHKRRAAEAVRRAAEEAERLARVRREQALKRALVVSDRGHNSFNQSAVAVTPSGVAIEWSAAPQHPSDSEGPAVELDAGRPAPGAARPISSPCATCGDGSTRDATAAPHSQVHEGCRSATIAVPTFAEWHVDSRPGVLT
jgi:hypothetical protein